MERSIEYECIVKHDWIIPIYPQATGFARSTTVAKWIGEHERIVDARIGVNQCSTNWVTAKLGGIEAKDFCGDQRG